jgi:hypothetical protein
MASLRLGIMTFAGGASGESFVEDSSLPVPLAEDAAFLNVDRAMNLYFTDLTSDSQQFDVWRVNPDGTIAGGVRVNAGCQLSGRQLYVDQAGAAWTMCSSANGTTVTRYPLTDQSGQVLPEAPKTPADVRWKPGTNFSAA